VWALLAERLIQISFNGPSALFTFEFFLPCGGETPPKRSYPSQRQVFLLKNQLQNDVPYLAHALGTPVSVPLARYTLLQAHKQSSEHVGVERSLYMGTILLIILILLLLGALPTWPYSSGWGYYPSGGLGLILIILIILLAMGRL
jgi:hypothetical protein